MRRLLVLLVLTAGFVVPGGGTAWACFCAGGIDTIQRAADERADAVYVGEILRVEPGRYVVRVDRSLRGGVSGIRVVRKSGSCDMRLRPGRVFMTEVEGESNVCASLTAQGREVDFAMRRWIRVNGAEPAPGSSPVAAATPAPDGRPAPDTVPAGGPARDSGRAPQLVLAGLLATVAAAAVVATARRT